MDIFGKNLKTKFTPLLLGIAAVVILIGGFVASSTYSLEVLAQAQPSSTLKPPATTQEVRDNQGQGGFVICGDRVSEPCTIDHLFIVLVMIINYLISVAGLVALLFIVIAGVQMTMSRGEEWYTAAKKRLIGAIIGLALVGLAFVLVNSLIAGSLSLGLKNGGLILTNPRAYIENTTNNGK